MINISYEGRSHAVVISVEGDVDAEQMRRAMPALVEAVPSYAGFKVLVDLSSVESMEPEVKDEMFKAMEFLDAQGVSEIVRVLPDPELDLGFTLMARAHYSKQVRFRTVRTREEAEALLQTSGT